MEHTDDQQIEAYLRNKMTPEERQRFEDALAADPELRRRTDELRRLAGSVRQMALADTRRRVEAVREKIRTEEKEGAPPGKSGYWHWLVVGLILAGLVWLGYRYFYPPEMEQEDKKPTMETRETPPQQPAGPVANTPDTPRKEPADELGKSAVEPFSSDNVPVLDSRGKATGRTIRVDQYRDSVRLYILKGNLLELYIPPGKELPRPVVIIDREGRLYLRLPGGSEVQLQATGEAAPF